MVASGGGGGGSIDGRPGGGMNGELPGTRVDPVAGTTATATEGGVFGDSGKFTFTFVFTLMFTFVFTLMFTLMFTFMFTFTFTFVFTLMFTFMFTFGVSQLSNQSSSQVLSCGCFHSLLFVAICRYFRRRSYWREI